MRSILVVAPLACPSSILRCPARLLYKAASCRSLPAFSLSPVHRCFSSTPPIAPPIAHHVRSYLCLSRSMSFAKCPIVRQSGIGGSSLRFSNGILAERNRPSFSVCVVPPGVSLIGGLVSKEKCFWGVGGGDCRWWAGEDAHSCLLDCGDKRTCAIGVRAHQPAAAAACFSVMRRRGMHSRSDGGLERSRRTLSPIRGAAFIEDGQSRKAGAPLPDSEKDEVSIKQTNKLLTIPTILTLARVAAVPAMLAVFYSNEPWATAAGAGIFVLASITDWLDGYLARKMGTSSAFGAFLDPVADKLMVAAALVLLCTKPLAIADLASIPWLLPVPTIAIIGREITMSAVREWAASQGGDLHKAVAVNKLGKIKTASQMIAITILLASGEGGLDSTFAGVVGVGLLYVAAFLALWSLTMYMKGIWVVLGK